MDHMSIKVELIDTAKLAPKEFSLL